MEPKVDDVFTAAFQLPCLVGVERFELFRAVAGWALEHLHTSDGQVWRRTQPCGAGQKDGVSYTAAECRGILANAFLGNVLDPMGPFKKNQCGLDFAGHYLRGASSSVGGLSWTCLYCGGVGGWRSFRPAATPTDNSNAESNKGKRHISIWLPIHCAKPLQWTGGPPGP